MEMEKKYATDTPSVYYIEDEVVFTRVDHRLNADVFYNINTLYLPSNSGTIISYFMLESGYMDLVIDNLPVRCDAAGDNVMSVGMSKNVSRLDTSRNMSGYMLSVGKLFMDKMMKGRKILSMSQILSMRKQSGGHMRLEGDDAILIKGCLLDVERYLADDKHLFGMDLARMAVMTFMYENINIVLSHGRIIPEKRVLDRNEEMVARFIDKLSEHIEWHREVSYYADRLCVTPHYLSKVIKSVLGKPARRIIEEMLIERSIIMLREPDCTAQQVADKLHFSDQSSFGKFFKRHMGMSPMQFKRKM
ncbi:MAG: helix-turn-helix domain-containing protein [Rikenellaceae bacterium]|nr:helix-turn-helix domain-containing protein [Rikenellaceae bacterium]